MFIYCYTNKVNGKKYVGQSNNPERRKREHRSRAFDLKHSDYNMPFYAAIRKYGFDSFDYEILLETTISKANEDEIRLISELGSLVSEHGYNVQLGGQMNSQYMKSLTDEEASQLREDLKTEAPIKHLVEKYGISETLVSNINIGLKYFSQKETYPIRKRYKEDSEYKELLYLLKETDLSFRAIAEKIDIAESSVKKINYGKMRKGLSETYPIRPYKRKPVSTIPKA